MFPYSRNNCSLRAVLLLTRLSRQFSRTKPLLKRPRTSMGFLSCAMYLSKTRRTLVPHPYRMVNKQTCGRHGDKAPISWSAKKWRRSRGGCREWFIYSDPRTSTRNSRSVLRVFPVTMAVYSHRGQLLQIARRHFDLGGERMRFTFPALITSSIRLCRRYKNREHEVRASAVEPASCYSSRRRSLNGRPKFLLFSNLCDN